MKDTIPQNEIIYVFAGGQCLAEKKTPNPSFTRGVTFLSPQPIHLAMARNKYLSTQKFIEHIGCFKK